LDPLATLIEQKLQESGLTLDDQLGFQGATADQLAALGITEPRGGFVIPYCTLAGQPSGFFRVRHLEKPSGFGGAVDPRALRRYSQPPGSLNEAYLPPLIDWARLAADPSHDLIITEGELKAACATKLGFPTIGLGGVAAWQSGKKGVDLVPPLDQLQWRGRRVTILYDSDLITNANVQAEQLKLADKLITLGAVVRVGCLPVVSADKVGLDDYLMQLGPDALRYFLESDALQPPQLYRHLTKFNEELAFLTHHTEVIDLTTGIRYRPKDFKDAYGNRIGTKAVVKRNAQGVRVVNEPCQLAVEWLRWPGRLNLATVTYAPGQPRFHDGSYNMWAGWGCQPKPRPIEPWHKMLSHLFGADQANKRWFEQWLAYPLQHPGAKLHSAVLIWSPEKGNGKSWTGYTIGRIYGQNAVELTQDRLLGRFNTLMSCKQFIIGSEITGTDNRQHNDVIKHLITRPKAIIEAKNRDAIEVTDTANFFLTSNRPTAYHVDDGERRLFVWEVRGHRATSAGPGTTKLSQGFKLEYEHWLETGGAEGLFHHLMQLDLTGFRHDDPPLTEDKEAMRELCRSELESWLHQVVHDPSLLWQGVEELNGKPLKGRLLFTALDLLHLYRATQPANDRISKGAVERALGAMPNVQRKRVKLPAHGNVYVYYLGDAPAYLEHAGRGEVLTGMGLSDKPTTAKF